MQNGVFRSKTTLVNGVEYPTSLAGKQFGRNLDEVIELADTPILGDAAAVIKVDVPNSVLKQLDLTPLDEHILKSGSVTVQPGKLQIFNNSISQPKQAF